jgi:uncharacterized 2Fe-2S/4Fe-4S cluster protein (DUF4445 family)
VALGGFFVLIDHVERHHPALFSMPVVGSFFKGGVCATCRCKVVEGKVDMDANYALEDYEIARGFVLSCQSFPVTDKLLLDFDQDN